MKKLLFVLAFAFIGQQAFSQMYMLTWSSSNIGHPSGCNLSHDGVITKIDPAGNVTYTCMDNTTVMENPSTFVTLNQEINIIINQGYKLIYTGGENNVGVFFDDNGRLRKPMVWFFSIP